MKRLVIGVVVLWVTVFVVSHAGGEKSYWNPDQLKINALQLAVGPDGEPLTDVQIEYYISLPKHPEVNGEERSISEGYWIWVRPDLKLWVMFDGCDLVKVVAQVNL